MDSSDSVDYEPSFTPKQDQTYKLKFNPKKKCSRCEQVNAFSCEHNVFVRENIRTSFNKRGKYYNHPRLRNSVDVSSSLDEDTPRRSQDMSDDDRSQLNRDRMNKFGKPHSLVHEVKEKAGEIKPLNVENFKAKSKVYNDKVAEKVVSGMNGHLPGDGEKEEIKKKKG